MLNSSCGSTSKLIDGVLDHFPAGLRVLVVDDDVTCLRILEAMLRKCLYEVTKCDRAEIALKILRDNKKGFDIVISDVHMPDMDGFKLLEHVGLEMDLPVIMMSGDDSKDVVMKGVTHGACDYLIKPVRIEALKNIWQHVIRKTKHEPKDKDCGQNGSVEDDERKQKSEEDVDNSTTENNEGNRKTLKKRKDEEDEDEDEDEDEEKEKDDDTSASKKPRIVWSRDLHEQFLTAVNHIGYEKAVPKRILEVMNVPGLTRENVASHLQKYRIFLRKKNGLDSPQIMGPPDVNFGSVPSFHGMDFQGMSSNQFPGLSLAAIQSRTRSLNKSPVSVMDQRNINPFSGVSPVEHQIGGRKIDQMSFLHGIIPMNIESNQLTNLNQSASLFGSSMNVQVNPQNSSQIVPGTHQPVSRPNGNTGSSAGQPILLNGVSNGNTGSSAGQPILLNGVYNGNTGSSPGQPILLNGVYNGSTGSSAGQPILLNGVSSVGGIRSTVYPPTASLPPSVVDFSMNGDPSLYGNIFHGARNAGGVSRGFVNGCGYIDDLHQYKTRGLHSVGSTIDASHQGAVKVPPSSNFVQPAIQMIRQAGAGEVFFSPREGGQNGNNSYPGLPLDHPFLTNRAPNVNQQDPSCPNNLFSQSSDDILNALLKPLDDVGSVENVFDELSSNTYPSDLIA